MGAETEKSGYRYVIQRLTLILVGTVILFVAAGTLLWIRGWVWVISTLLLETGTLMVLAKYAPETLNQRGTWHAGVKSFDKLFIICWLLIGELITPVIAGLDRRFEWSHMPTVTLYCGIILVAFAWSFGTWAMVTNEHFEQFVRIQTDRKHQVVTSGPYRIIRHPGYGAHILGAVAMPLILGTWWTFIPAGAVILLFILRTTLEDRTLRTELEGYEAYAQKTRCRLLPGVW
jgi:protein-S-isoprenylcysteine O-methyltransferase Ste14